MEESRLLSRHPLVSYFHRLSALMAKCVNYVEHYCSLFPLSLPLLLYAFAIFSCCLWASSDLWTNVAALAKVTTQCRVLFFSLMCVPLFPRCCLYIAQPQSSPAINIKSMSLVALFNTLFITHTQCGRCSLARSVRVLWTEIG